MEFTDLFKSDYKSKNPEKRLKAVSKIDDENLLARLAMNDTSPRVRKAAVDKVKNQNLLMKIALDSHEIDTRISAVQRIDCQEKLANIIKVRKNYQLMGACFANITDKKTLEKIAHDPEYNISARRIAIENYADESLLAELDEHPSEADKTKSKEEIEQLIEQYGEERLIRTFGKFRGSQNAIRALGEIIRKGGEPAQTAVEYLAKSLVHANPEIRQSAEEELATLTDPDLIAKLIGMIDNATLHEKIVAVLKRIDHPDAKQFL